jgi:hypothetical protein
MGVSIVIPRLASWFWLGDGGRRVATHWKNCRRQCQWGNRMKVGTAQIRPEKNLLKCQILSSASWTLINASRPGLLPLTN